MKKIKAVSEGRLSTEAAQKGAMEMIRKMRYDNGTGYIWINNTQSPYPKMIMHPTVPTLEGNFLDDGKYNCALGKKKNLFVAFVDVCEKEGEGYFWINDVTTPFPKMVMHPISPALEEKVLDNPKYNCALAKQT